MPGALDSGRNVALASALCALAGYVDGIGYLHLGGLFQIDGGGGLGLTYVTGALVRVAQFIAAALIGGARFAWLPNLLLWAALVAGSVCGALAYLWINLAAIWFAAAAASTLTALVAATIHR